MVQETLSPATFTSSLLVFAEKIQQERQARKNYFIKSKSGLMKEKEEALKELKKVENEVDVLLYGILHKPETRRRQTA